jgi:hypothetical protein
MPNHIMCYNATCTAVVTEQPKCQIHYESYDEYKLMKNEKHDKTHQKSLPLQTC